MKMLRGMVIAVVLLPVLCAAQGEPNKEAPWPPNDRVKIPQWNFVNVFSGVVDARTVDTGADGKAVKTIKERLQAAGDGSRLQAIGDLFKDYPFEVVERVAKAKHLTEVEADGLARMRRQMINEVMAKTIEGLDPQKQLTIGMLDSGNKNSGIASDVDQTVFVMPKDLAGKLAINEAKVIAEFNKQFKQRFGVAPERLGIESLNGADFFPDWRQAHSTDKIGTGASEIGKEATALMEEADRVVGEKRKNPEAYRSEGQLKSQAEGRGYKALQEHHQRVRDLTEARERIESIEKNPGLDEAQRRAQTAEIEGALLKQYGKAYPAGSIAELEQRFNKDSPWTEVGWDKDGKVTTSQMEDPKDKVLANKPEFSERFAFDGAWDNWLMYEHHPHNRRKYLLRSVAEGISLKRQQGGRPLSTFEYEKVYAKGTMDSQQELKAFIDDVYRDLPDAVRGQFKKAMDVAAKERLLHKGVKNPSTGQDYTLKEVWSEYWPAVSEQERALYRDMPPEAFEKMLHERAVRQWEAVGREVMIENLLRTGDEPAKRLANPMTDAEMARVQGKYPNATRAKLSKAVQRQLYHGIYDLISYEHARELVTPPDQRGTLPARQTDLVDRLLQKLGTQDPEWARQVRQIAVSAAWKRVQIEPGQRSFRQAVAGYMHEQIKERLSAKAADFKEVYDSARSTYGEYKAGKLTQEVVTRKLTISAAERWMSAKVYGRELLGFDVKNANLLIPERGWPTMEVEYGAQKWSAAKLLGNVASPGNLDSALTVMLAYQEGGSKAAAWAAGYEVMMNFPVIAKANAVKDLVVNRNPQGIVMLGSAMAVPVLGQAYMLINIGKTSVTLLGHYVLDPLKDDDADKMYQGFLDERSGFRGIERSQRPSLLHFVPIRVILRTIEGPDGKPVPTVLWKQYSRQEADRLFNVLDDKEYARLADSGALGGGEAWEAAYAEVRDEVSHPKASFEAKRASMVYAFRDRIQVRLTPKKLDPDEEEAFPLIVQFFMEYVDDWVNAKGEFADFGENLLISRRFEDPALRQRIASRAAQDFVYSHNIVRGSIIEPTTIERNIEAAIEQHRLQETTQETNAMVQAIDEAWEVEPDPATMHAIHQELDKRKEDARVRSPRFHARPVLVTESRGQTTDPNRDQEQRIEFLISVIDGPEPQQKEPANREYKTSVRYELEVAGKDEMEVTAYVQVTGAQTGERIPPYVPADCNNFKATDKKELAIRLGKIGRLGSMPESVDLKVAYQLKHKDAKPPVTPPATVGQGGPGVKPQRPETTTDGAGNFFEDWNAKKAAPRPDRWGGKDVSSLSAQLWICWEKAPLGRFYYYEMTVSGGAQGYKQGHDGMASPRDRFPDANESSGRANVFILPFEWPEGHVGSFTLKGTLYAFDKDYPNADWKQATPVAKLDFQEPFEISDQRVDTNVNLMVRYRKAVPVAELGSIPQLTEAQREGYALSASGGKAFVERIDRFDSNKADLWPQRWGDAEPGSITGIRTELYVRWKDAPPKAVYYYDVEVKGGTPVFKEKKESEITPMDEFPPAPYKSGPGSTAFAFDVPWPYRNGGRFEIKGTLYALPKQTYSGDSWRQQKPLATFPFEQRFELHNRSRFAKGTVSNYDSTVYVQVLLAYVQQGKRPVQVTSGGRTIYTLLDNDYYTGGYFQDKPRPSHWVNVRMPFGIPTPSEATVSFVDFGERVTMTVPLELERPVPDWSQGLANIAKAETQSLQKIEGWMKKTPLSQGALDAINREYFNLARSFATFDYEKRKKYAALYVEYDQKYYQMELAQARDDASREQVRESLSQSAETPYWGAVEWGHVGDATAAFQQAVAQIQGAGMPAGKTNAKLYQLYQQHAEKMVCLTGDLEQAKSLWRQAQEFGKNVPDLFSNRGEEPCPYDIDDSFKGQRPSADRQP